MKFKCGVVYFVHVLQAGTKLAERPARMSDHGKEQCPPAPMSSSDRYAAAYSASGRNSLRLSTASYSTLGEEMTSFGEISASRDKRKMRGACDDQSKTVNAYGVRPPEVWRLSRALLCCSTLCTCKYLHISQAQTSVCQCRRQPAEMEANVGFQAMWSIVVDAHRDSIAGSCPLSPVTP